MAKLQLKAEPTFQASVGIPVAGGEAVPVLLTFKHRTRTELDAFIKSRPKKSDAESFMDMVQGWDLEDEFTEANVKTLLENYIGAALATFHAYIDQLVQAKAKN
jgi:hypothetical protein